MTPQEIQLEKCYICEYRKIEHGASWCYMFWGMLYNCQRFTPLHTEAEDVLPDDYYNTSPAE